MEKKFYKLIPGSISRMSKFKAELEKAGHQVMVYEFTLYYQLYW